MTEVHWQWLAIVGGILCWLYLLGRVMRLEQTVAKLPVNEDLHKIRESLSRLEATMEAVQESLQIVQLHLLEKRQ